MATLTNETKSAPEAEKKTKSAEEQAAWLEERVPARLFKGSGYTDDVFVCVNGEACQIQRGVDVMVKRKFALALENSVNQDEEARRAAEFAGQSCQAVALR